MDNIKELKHWILDNSKAIKLEVERLHWIKEWFPGHYDFRVTAEAYGRTFEGRGIDANEDNAFYKSFSELVERIFCFGHGINSNGVAAHYNEKEAILNAKRELIERDAILCHHLTETPFVKVKYDHPTISVDSLSERLNRQGIHLSFAEAKSFDESLHVVICKASGGKQFGSLFGFGCHYELSKVFGSAIFECMINVVAILEGSHSIRHLELDDFLDKKIPTREHHQRIHFSHDLIDLELTDKATPNDCRTTSIEEIGIRVLNSPLPIFSSVPLFVVKAESESFQNIFYGNACDENVNLNRLRSFSGQGNSLKKLNTIPHPIG